MQKALRDRVQNGVIVRRQGQGTSIAQREIVRLDRIFSVAHQFECCSGFYIDATRHPVFASAQMRALSRLLKKACT